MATFWDKAACSVAHMFSLSFVCLYFSTPEPKAHGELIVYQSICRLCVCPSTFLNINISETGGPIATKIYLKHHWGGRKAALCYEKDRIGTMVSMATDSSHMVIMGKT